MALRGALERTELAAAVGLLADLAGERVPLAPLLPHALALFDQVGAHDAFYVVLAQLADCALLTSDGPLASAAQALGIEVIYRA